MRSYTLSFALNLISERMTVMSGRETTMTQRRHARRWLTENGFATRTELRLFSRQAGNDAAHIWNLASAQPKNVTHAG
jgi:hypothetical protein